jgi:hypothetical protein
MSINIWQITRHILDDGRGQNHRPENLKPNTSLCSSLWLDKVSRSRRCCLTSVIYSMHFIDSRSMVIGNHLIQWVSVTPPSVLFSVFMVRVRYNLEQRIFIYVCYEKKSYRRKYHLRFPDTCPPIHIISKLVKKVGTHCILIDRNS